MSRPSGDPDTTTEGQSLRVVVQREKARIPHVVLGTGAAARELRIDQNLIVGASADAGLVLQDTKVSRMHAELEPGTDGLWVRDLGSKNGTWVDGIRVGSALIPDGSRITLGDTVLLVRYRNGERERELWPETRLVKMVGSSLPMRAMFARIARCAESDATVLIRGETGTGKELVADALHELSKRRAQPLVVVDCGAMPANLLEAELFGVKRGAFTGADRDREGAFEAADGGTIFLDELGELPLDLQPKLLRMLETRTFRRLGETTHRKADVRVVCATHRDLRQSVAAGTFREDLYFRVAVLLVDVPPLRDRQEDVADLVAHFAAGAFDAVELEDLVRRAKARPWPGNVRELRNFVERARALGVNSASTQRTANVVQAPEAPKLGFDVPDDKPLAEVRQLVSDYVEKEYLKRVLARFGGNVTRAAEHAGVARQHLHRLIKRHEDG
jgi:DNA-binding NtrC family response regulator